MSHSLSKKSQVNDATVFVVDDDASLREGIRSLLCSVGHEVEAFESSEEFLEQHDQNRMGCLVLDVRLPGSSGLELQKRLLAMNDHIPIIFISGNGDIPMCVQTMKAGAADFLSKPFREQDLLEAVQAALRHEQARRAQELFVLACLAAYRSLTQREREIMKLVVAGQINKQIAIALGISEVTVKTHRARMMRKMSTNSLADLARIPDKLETILAHNSAIAGLS